VALLVAIVVLGAGLRFYGLYWGFPYHLHCDENKLVGVAHRLAESWAQSRSLNPDFSAYGALPVYLDLAGGAVARLLGSLQGYEYTMSDSLLIAGRVISACADVLSMLLVFLLGRLVSVRTGLWGAALYSVALVSVREAHFFSPDSLSTCLVLLYVYRCALIPRRHSRKDYAWAGVTLGLALSVKFTVLPLAFLVLVVYWMEVKQGALQGGDNRPFVMKRHATRMRGLVVGLMILSAVPALGWVAAQTKIRSVAHEALNRQLDETRLFSHSAAYWRAQVDSVYRGGAQLLGGVAVAGFLGGLLALHALTSHRGPRTSHEAYTRLWGPGAFFGVAAVTFLAINPYSLLDPFGYWAPAGPDKLTWNLFMVGGALRPPPGWTLQFEGTYPYVYQFIHVFPYAWGPPLTALLTIALLWTLRALVARRTGNAWAVAAGALILTLLMGRMWVKMTRYIMPLTPMLCVLAGVVISRRLRAPGVVWRVIGWGLVGAVWVFSFIWCVGYVSIYGQTDNRVAALEWLRTNARDADFVLYEKDDAWGAAGEYALRTAGSYTIDRYDPTTITDDYVGGVLTADAIQRKERYVGDRLAKADLLVLTDATRLRLGPLGQQFPIMNDFYAELSAGAGEFRRAAAFEMGPRFAGRPVDDSGAEPTFRLFDHPKVYIYRRVSGKAGGRGRPGRHGVRGAQSP